MITLKITKRVRGIVIAVVCLSLVSGLAFYYLNTWVEIEGEFGPQKHPWQFPILKVHAISAFVMMFLYGMFWATHVQLGWRSKRSRNTGSVMTAVIGCQVVTAYLLYYLSDETWRLWTSYIHIAIGISIPLALFAHIVVARKQRALKLAK